MLHTVIRFLICNLKIFKHLQPRTRVFLVARDILNFPSHYFGFFDRKIDIRNDTVNYLQKKKLATCKNGNQKGKPPVGEGEVYPFMATIKIRQQTNKQTINVTLCVPGKPCVEKP